MDKTVCKTFVFGIDSVQVDCFWFNNDGDGWEFACQVQDTGSRTHPAQFSNASPTVSTIDNVIADLNSERAFVGGTDGPIKGATNDVKVAMAVWIAESASELKPTCSAHDSYFGI
jgi:hypothetical protein